MTRTELPLAALVAERCRELGLRRSEVAARCGYKNISKGLRRLEQVSAGELEKADALLRRLPEALDLSPRIVQEAVDETVRQIAAEKEAVWRASFQPSAYLLGTSNQPSQLLLFAISDGAERWLKIPLDQTQPPASYAEQALTVVPRTPVVQFFGRTTGFIVNYRHDYAVRFDLEGQPIETLMRAYRTGEVTLCLGRRQVSAENLGRVLGTIPREKD